MRKTALVYHEDYLKHDAGRFHPERKERLTKTLKFIEERKLLEKLELLTPNPAKDEDLLRAHTEEHVNFIKELCRGGGGAVDGDTHAQENTYDIAKLAAGGVMLAGEAVAQGTADNSFALTRPPGHHVTMDKAMGFCYFNNVAVMIKDLKERFGIKKIFLLDWDAHAFNGTMDIFYEDPSVLDISIHQDPYTFYPGTGFIDQIGRHDGEGYTINIPVPAGTGDQDYLYILSEFVIPVAREFRPELVIISAGSDSHRDDSISGLRLTERGYSKMTSMMLQLAGEFCSGKMVVELEGGYNLEALARTNYEILQSLLGISPNREIYGGIRGSTSRIVDSLKDIFENYHKI